MNQTRNTKSRKASHLIAVLTVFTMLFCLAGCGKKTPRETLEEAYEKTFTENNPTENLLGLSELNTKLTGSKAHSTGFSFTIQELSCEELGEYAAFLSGLGLSVDSASDLLNRKSAATLDITYGGTTYLTLGGQIQDSEIYLTSPQLLDNSISVNLSTLEEDLNSDSLIAQLIRAYGIAVPENLSADLFSTFASTTALTNLGKLTSACEDLNDAILVETLDKKEVSLPANISSKTVYSVTIPEYAYAAVLNALIDLSADYSSTLSDSSASDDLTQEDYDLLNTKLAIQQLAETIGDLVLTVSVTKDGTINYVASTIAQGSDSISFTATFTGETNPLDEIAVNLNVVAQGTTLGIAYEQFFDSQDNEIAIFMNATADGTTVCTFGCVGQYSDIEKGKKYAFDYDYIEFEIKDLLFISLSGDFYVDTTKCNITAPGEAKYNLLRMDATDFSELYEEVERNLQENPIFSTLFGALDFGM